MDPEKIKIPVPMSDAQRIYAALGSLKRIAAMKATMSLSRRWTG